MTEYESQTHKAETAKSYDEMINAIDALIMLLTADEIVETEATR